MAPLPETNTARLLLDYTSMQREHTLMVRPARNLLGAEKQDMAQAFATVMKARMLNIDSVVQARYADAGDAFTVPIPFNPQAGLVSVAGNVWAQDPESANITIVARSHTSGRRVRYTLFTGVSTDPWPTNNRYEPGDAAVIDTFRLNFTTLVEGEGDVAVPLVAIDGNFVTVYNYVNLSLNAYWQRKQRRGG